MKQNMIALGLMAGLLWVATAVADDGKNATFGDAKFIAWEGDQSWPTGDGAQVIKDYSVPIYIGLPSKKYTVLGRIVDDRRTGIGVVGKAFAEGLFSEKDRQRDCANQAKYRGADALVLTSNEKIIQAFHLSDQDVHDTAPLFHHKDKVVLAIKFQ